MDRTRIGALLLAFSLAGTAQAQSTQISVRVYATNGDGVESQIWLRRGTIESSDRTDSNGRKSYSITCTENTAFRIRTVNPNFIYNTGWHPCQQPELPIQVMPVGSMRGFSLARSLEGVPQGGIYAARNSEIAAADQWFESAVKLGQWGEVAASSNELAALYRSVGDTDRAEKYSAAAIEVGAQVIATSNGAPAEDILIAESNGRPTETRAAKQILTEFQNSQGLATTRKWDFETFKAIRQLDDPSHAVVAWNPSGSRSLTDPFGPMPANVQAYGTPPQ